MKAVECSEIWILVCSSILKPSNEFFPFFCRLTSSVINIDCPVSSTVWKLVNRDIPRSPGVRAYANLLTVFKTRETWYVYPVRIMAVDFWALCHISNYIISRWASLDKGNSIWRRGIGEKSLILDHPPTYKDRRFSATIIQNPSNSSPIVVASSTYSPCLLISPRWNHAWPRLIVWTHPNHHT